MVNSKRWALPDLRKAVQESFSIRQVIMALGLRPAGGNYVHIQREIKAHNMDTSHFKGQGWNKGMKVPTKPRIPLSKILVKHSNFQSNKLKKRLYKAGLKKPVCEICNWAKQSISGRIPVELDHKNGDRFDNRLENLRILCPNCHSLQPTHRGRNIKKGKN